MDSTIQWCDGVSRGELSESIEHRIEEHDMLNWLKANRKTLNAGKMKLERVEKFIKLLKLTEHYKRKNQYQ